jgi:hypothetical protein
MATSVGRVSLSILAPLIVWCTVNTARVQAVGMEEYSRLQKGVT